MLDEIDGIGPKRRDALLAKYKSIDAIKKRTSWSWKDCCRRARPRPCTDFFTMRMVKE